MRALPDLSRQPLRVVVWGTPAGRVSPPHRATDIGATSSCLKARTLPRLVEVSHLRADFDALQTTRRVHDPSQPFSESGRAVSSSLGGVSRAAPTR